MKLKLIIYIDKKHYKDFVLQTQTLGEDLCDSPSGLAKYVIAHGITLSEMQGKIIEEYLENFSI